MVDGGWWMVDWWVKWVCLLQGPKAKSILVVHGDEG
jgi:hypothetical protein